MNEGDFTEVEFTGKANGSVFETTSADEAKKAGIFEENRPYGPVLAVAGKKMLVPGLDEEIVKAKEGDSKSISLTPEKAFGPRNADLVRLIPSSKFKEQGIGPTPGMSIDVDGMPARVVGVEGGRVRLDFNHPLAGMNVDYSFKIVKTYTGTQDKVSALVKNFFPNAGVTTKLEGQTARFLIPSGVRKDAAFVQQKYRTVELLLSFVTDLKKVVFEEEYAAEKPVEKAASAGEKP
ncbi:TPA: peptidylprolyl isomerase [Candidatus Micrarchaeota archaeon]|nr:peptidylprolyl isomerase [Candidatus Micrarchaeota archaeon]